jgi:hypothetical protein
MQVRRIVQVQPPPNVQSGGGMKGTYGSIEPMLPVRPTSQCVKELREARNVQIGQACKFNHPVQAATGYFHEWRSCFDERVGRKRIIRRSSS